MNRRPLLIAAALAAIFPAAVNAQSAGGGGGVPAYEPPAPVAAPVRDGEVMARHTNSANADSMINQGPAITSQFADAYARRGRPKLALFWNRQLSDSLSDWYSDVRVVEQSESKSGMSGDFNLNQNASSQNSMEVQRRVTDPRRINTTESFEWEFQDAFLAPFLEAGATVLDRAAIIRMTAADINSNSDRMVEIQALRGKADYLMEVLVSANGKSTVGYELRARILDVKTGAIVAMVNSKNLKEWNPEKPVIVTDTGFSDPSQSDDDDSFGPQGDDKFRATSQGFQKRRKPPKLAKIAQSLAYNTMSGLSRQWK